MADGFQHEEIEVDHTGQLAERETHGQPVAYIHGHVQDEHEQGEIEHGHQGWRELSGDMGSTKLPYRARPSADSAVIPVRHTRCGGAGSFFVQGYSDSAIRRKTMQPKRSNCNMDASLDLRG